MVDLRKIEDEIDEWTGALNIENRQGADKKIQNKNAFAHAYASAVITYDAPKHIGGLIATALGNGREYKSFFFDSLKAARGKKNYSLSGVFRDGHRDLFNNEVGVSIGNYARRKNLPRESIGYLVSDAVRNQSLVSDEFSDPRVGALNYHRPRYIGPSSAGLGEMRYLFGLSKQ